MSLKNKYKIEESFITNSANRSRAKMKPKYGVAHETANNSADAEAHVRYFNNHSVQASYNILVDSERIIMTIPLDEKSMHVQRRQDRQTLGLGLANDFALSVSICRTGDFSEAYDRYVWAWAYLCVKFGWSPFERITAHRFEDPSRRSDPQSWLEPNGVTWNKFLNDVNTYVKEWNGVAEIKKPNQPKAVVETGREDDLIRHGDKGNHVKELQEKLIAAGFSLPRFGADGHFGDETEKALRDFQRVAGIGVDGIFGPQSANALDSYKRPAPTTPKVNYSRLLRLTRPYMRGDDIKAVQRKVGVKVDGIYGPITERAVRDYQRRHGLTVDGIVGPQTWNRMF